MIGSLFEMFHGIIRPINDVSVTISLRILSDVTIKYLLVIVIEPINILMTVIKLSMVSMAVIK